MVTADARCPTGSYTTTLTCTSGDLSMVYRASQDTMAGWRHVTVTFYRDFTAPKNKSR